jgi:hypothetical protein
MVRKSILLAFLISVSFQSFLIFGNACESKIYSDTHFAYNQLSYEEIIELLDDLQSQLLNDSSVLEINEPLRLIKVSIEKNISCYYYDQKRVLIRKLSHVKRQVFQLRAFRPRLVFSILAPVTAGLSYYYLQEELTTKWKIIVGSIGCMSLLGLADYVDFISYVSKRLPDLGQAHVDIKEIIDEIIAVLNY